MIASILSGHMPGPWVIENGELLSRQPDGDTVLGMIYGLEYFPSLDEDQVEETEDPTGNQEEMIATGRLIQVSTKLLAACLKAEDALAGAVLSHSRGCSVSGRWTTGTVCDCWLKDRAEALRLLREVLMGEPPA